MTGMSSSSRRSFLVQLSAAAMSMALPARAEETGDLLFAASYQRDGTHDQPSPTHAIHAFRWDADRGTLAACGKAIATPSPGFLALSHDRRYLYAANMTNEYRGEQTGTVTSFAVRGNTGRLKKLNMVRSGGSVPCEISIDFTNRAAFVANFSGGSASSFQVRGNGRLSEAVSHFPYSPEGAARSHAHCATVSPDNRFVLINDLGLNRIWIYRLDSATAQLTPNDPPYLQLTAGSGPRSFAFHPTGKYAYSLNETAGTVDALSWEAKSGVLTRLQTISTLPEGFTGRNMAATLVVDAEGRFVYASNRGDNSIVAFAISDGDGTLKLVQRIDSGGEIPRHFALDPGNQWLLAANQNSSNIAVFARNQRTGMLEATGRRYPVDYPVCLVFRQGS
jgi:6-phosphogluconolactonase